MTIGELKKDDYFILEKGCVRYQFISFKTPYAEVLNQYEQKVNILVCKGDTIQKVNK